MKDLSLKHTAMFLKYRLKKLDFYIACILMAVSIALVSSLVLTLDDPILTEAVSSESTIGIIISGCFPFLVVYSATAFGMEYGNKTIYNLITSKYDIVGLYFSKLIAHLLVTFLFTVVAFLLTVGFNYLLDYDMDYLNVFITSLISFLVFAAWWFSFGTLVAVSTKSFMATIIGTLLAYFIGPNLILLEFVGNDTLTDIVYNIPFTFANENNVGVVLETSQYIYLGVSGIIFMIISIYILKKRPIK